MKRSSKKELDTLNLLRWVSSEVSVKQRLMLDFKYDMSNKLIFYTDSILSFTIC